MRRASSRTTRQGFVFWLLAISLLAILGIAGLAVDVGRLQNIKGEAQSYADFAALAAARQLDGTAEGLDRARRAVLASPMKWDFQTRPFEDTAIEFSPDRKTWSSRSADPASICCVRVTATVRGISLFLIPAVAGPRSASVSASASAASEPALRYPAGSAGLLPFAVEAHHVGKPEFGIAPGATVPLDRYIQAPQDLRISIEEDRVGLEVSSGRPLPAASPPTPEMAAALQRRASQDSNLEAHNYLEYQRKPGNGRRLARVAVTGGGAGPAVVGFARIFLPVSQPPSGPVAEWIGREIAPSPGGISAVRLIE
jgi:hypothetical protein